MPKKLIIILILIFFKGYSQENPKIDSLKQEILKLERQVKEINDEIKSEILQNGYIVVADGNNGSSSLALQDEESRKVIGIIPRGSKIKVVGKTSNFYKVQYNDIVGLVNIYNIKVDSTSSIYLQYPKTREIETSSFNISRPRYKKPLNYSKPIKVRGHYRTTKSGKRVWVRPHTRKH